MKGNGTSLDKKKVYGAMNSYQKNKLFFFLEFLLFNTVYQLFEIIILYKMLEILVYKNLVEILKDNNTAIQIIIASLSVSHSSHK